MECVVPVCDLNTSLGCISDFNLRDHTQDLCWVRVRLLNTELAKRHPTEVDNGPGIGGLKSGDKGIGHGSNVAQGKVFHRYRRGKGPARTEAKSILGPYSDQLDLLPLALTVGWPKSRARVWSCGVKARPTVTMEAFGMAVRPVVPPGPKTKVPDTGMVKLITAPSATPVTAAPARCWAPLNVVAAAPL